MTTTNLSPEIFEIYIKILNKHGVQKAQKYLKAISNLENAEASKHQQNLISIDLKSRKPTDNSVNPEKSYSVTFSGIPRVVMDNPIAKHLTDWIIRARNLTSQHEKDLAYLSVVKMLEEKVKQENVENDSNLDISKIVQSKKVKQGTYFDDYLQSYTPETIIQFGCVFLCGSDNSFTCVDFEILKYLEENGNPERIFVKVSSQADEDDVEFYGNFETIKAAEDFLKILKSYKKFKSIQQLYSFKQMPKVQDNTNQQETQKMSTHSENSKSSNEQDLNTLLRSKQIRKEHQSDFQQEYKNSKPVYYDCLRINENNIFRFFVFKLENDGTFFIESTQRYVDFRDFYGTFESIDEAKSFIENLKKHCRINTNKIRVDLKLLTDAPSEDLIQILDTKKTKFNATVLLDDNNSDGLFLVRESWKTGAQNFYGNFESIDEAKSFIEDLEEYHNQQEEVNVNKTQQSSLNGLTAEEFQQMRDIFSQMFIDKVEKICNQEKLQNGVKNLSAEEFQEVSQELFGCDSDKCDCDKSEDKNNSETDKMQKLVKTFLLKKIKNKLIDPASNLAKHLTSSDAMGDAIGDSLHCSIVKIRTPDARKLTIEIFPNIDLKSNILVVRDIGIINDIEFGTPFFYGGFLYLGDALKFVEDFEEFLTL